MRRRGGEAGQYVVASLVDVAVDSVHDGRTDERMWKPFPATRSHCGLRPGWTVSVRISLGSLLFERRFAIPIM
jgi:hypothetical protein